MTFPVNSVAAAGVTSAGKPQQLQPNVNASNIYQSQKMVLGSNIRNLVILIPNEAHEPPGLLPKDLRVANQPYIPQNVVVNVGTTVVWFNGDVGHFHSISILNDKNMRNESDSGLFRFFTSSKPIKFNDTGTFTFSESKVDKKYPNYVLKGTITVVNQSPSSSNNTDTVTTFMVPAPELAKDISQFKGQGFETDSTYIFKSIRGGGSESGGSSQESLLVLTSSGKTLDQVLPALKALSPTMPYT